MATSLPAWNTDEEITSSKLNGINNSIKSDIEILEYAVQDLDDQGLYSGLVLGQGIYDKVGGDYLVSDGGGLNVSVAPGKALVNGTWVISDLSYSISLTDNAVNRVYITDQRDGGATTGAIPSRSIVLAEVTTSGGTITNISDKRQQILTLVDLKNLIDNHTSRHEKGGADELNVNGLSGELSDPQLAKITNLSGSVTKTAVAAGETITTIINHTALTIPAYPTVSTDANNVNLRILFSNGDEISNDFFTIEITNNDATQDITINWTRNGI
ncbi:hypothetical protein U472_00240 [Orenia metallireducens]|uniref:Uncharacterized protein n=1 Tax=Orenia metallireducens TaxID=1413210 RepID=A0A1C0ADB4_9FIRM|nr:hypothetical protein [Orenia metallireducens]OCL28621.1 hypothetical protein U472_00240 [Orenia metallireducens]